MHTAPFLICGLLGAGIGLVLVLWSQARAGRSVRKLAFGLAMLFWMLAVSTLTLSALSALG